MVEVSVSTCGTARAALLASSASVRHRANANEKGLHLCKPLHVRRVRPDSNARPSNVRIFSPSLRRQH